MNRSLKVLGLFLLFNLPARANETIKVDGWSMDGSPVYVHLRDPAGGPSHFNASLLRYKKRGSITTCTKFVEVPLASVETAYGGECTLKGEQHSTEVLICDDTGVGEFGLAWALKGIDSTAALIQFVADHCGGG